MASKSRSRKSSEIWGFFADLGDGKAKCNFCSTTMSYKGGNTFNLARHIRTKHPTVCLSSRRLAPPTSAEIPLEDNPDNPEPTIATTGEQPVPQFQQTISTASRQPQSQGTLSMFFPKPVSNKKKTRIRFFTSGHNSQELFAFHHCRK